MRMSACLHSNHLPFSIPYFPFSLCQWMFACISSLHHTFYFSFKEFIYFLDSFICNYIWLPNIRIQVLWEETLKILIGGKKTASYKFKNLTKNAKLKLKYPERRKADRRATTRIKCSCSMSWRTAIHLMQYGNSWCTVGVRRESGSPWARSPSTSSLSLLNDSINNCTVLLFD